MIKFKFGRIDFSCPLGWTVTVVKSEKKSIPIGNYVARVPQEMLEGRYKTGTLYTSDDCNLYECEIEEGCFSVKIKYIDFEEIEEVEEDEE